jgi:hypothetical protein
MLPHVRLRRLPRMADFALWATACESAFRPAGSASDLLQVGINIGGNAMAAWTRSGWPKSPRALAGRLRRAQTFLCTLGIEIVFGREGRLGTRTMDNGQGREPRVWHRAMRVAETKRRPVAGKHAPAR